MLLQNKGELDMTTIMGVRLDNRTQTAVDFQKALTQFGCIIKTRLGLHDIAGDKCAPNGLILLELLNSPEAREFETELSLIPGIEIKVMKFD